MNYRGVFGIEIGSIPSPIAVRFCQILFLGKKCRFWGKLDFLREPGRARPEGRGVCKLPLESNFRGRGGKLHNPLLAKILPQFFFNKNQSLPCLFCFLRLFISKL